MRSIIFFDIDGTLITEDERMAIPQSTREAIAMTREKGNLTFINSGRTAFNISPRVKKLGFDGYICGCGTNVEYNKEELLYHTIDKDECRRIAELMRKCNVTPVYEHKNGYFFDDKAPVTDGLQYFMEVFVDSGIDVSRRVEDDDFSFDKFVIWENARSNMELFRREVGKCYSIIDRGGGFYENVPLGFSKATGIEFILDYLNISLDKAYAIGDSMNDLPMLQAVPNSIAMGGAEKIYPYVSYITAPIESDGIYKALKHFKLI